jgi:hypothetical protein
MKVIIENSKQQLCPLVGFHGLDCKDQQSNATSRLLQTNTNDADQLLIKSIGLSYSSTSGQTRTQVLDFTWDKDHSNLYVDQRSNTSYLLPIELIVNNIDAQSANSFLLKDSPQSYFDIKESFLKSYSMVGGSFSEEFSFFEIFERFYAFMYKSSIAQQYIS